MNWSPLQSQLQHGHPVIYGRELERAKLRKLLDDAGEGQGALVLISGEGGIGKTTLVNDVARQAEVSGFLVLRGNCYDQSTTPPYGPWIEVVNDRILNDDLVTGSIWSHNPDTPHELSGQAALFTEVHEFLATAASDQSLLVVLEDFHWSDPESLQLLRFLARQIDELPVLLAVTYRDDQITRDHGLFSLIPMLVREAAVERIELQPLDENAVRAMLKTLVLSASDKDRLATYLLERGEGNPLFTLELLRALQADGTLRLDNDSMRLRDLQSVRIPSLVVQVIEERLKRLGRLERDLLETASVVGKVAQFQIWQEATEIDDLAFENCLEAAFNLHVLEETADRQAARFTHALVRETLYNSIPPIRRKTLHRSIGELVADLPHPDPDLVAYHFQQAGDVRARVWLVRAGLRAWKSFAWISAADRFERATFYLAFDPVHTAHRGWLLYLAGTLLRYDNIPKAIECFDHAEQLGNLVADEALVANCRWHRGVSLCHRGDVERGLSELRAGVEVLDRLADEQYLLSDEDQAEYVIRQLLPSDDEESGNSDAGLFRSSCQPSPAIVQRGPLINHLAHSGHYRETVEMGEAWLERIGNAFGDAYLQDISGVSGVLGLAHTHAMLGRPDDARREYRLAQSAAEAFGDYFTAGLCVLSELHRVAIPMATENIWLRSHLVDEANRTFSNAKDIVTGATFDIDCQVTVAFLEGRWDEAKRLGQGLGAALFGYAQDPILTLAEIARYQGNRDLAWEQVRLIFPTGPTIKPTGGDFSGSIFAQQLAIKLSLDAEEFETARVWLDAHDRWLDWSGAVIGQAESALLWSRYYFLLDQIDQARECADIALHHASAPRQHLALISVHRILGELENAERNVEDAYKHLRQSLELADVCQAPFERALTLINLAALDLKRGAGDRTPQQLAEARTICVPLSASLALDRINVLLSETDQEPVASCDLTPRQLEVLRLIADGFSDREIGEALFISHRTVMRHVSNILNTIGVDSRTAAATWAVRRRLI